MPTGMFYASQLMNQPAPSQKKPAPSPKGDYTYPQQQLMDPTVQKFEPMQAMKVPPRDTTSQQPRSGNIKNAISIYESMSGPDKNQGPGAIYAGGEVQERFKTSNSGSWRDRLYAERYATSQRGSSGAPSQAQRTIQPLQAIPVPGMPEYNAPAYAPPEEDPNAYSDARREAIAPGLREMREGTREAISSAQSLDNPNARSKFIKQALQGYGQGLEKVAAGAGREARQVAGQKRSEQLDTYRTQHSIQSDTYLKNYQNEINRISADFAQQQNIAMQNYTAQSDPNVTVASSPVSNQPRSAMEAGRSLRQQFYPGA